MASLKDAQKVVQEGVTKGWGKLVQLPENKRKEGLGFSVNKPGMVKPTGCTFHSARFIHASPEANAIIEDNSEEVAPVFVTLGGICCNWVAVDVPFVIHLSNLNINEPVEHSNLMLPPNFKFLVYKAVEEEDEEIPDEIRRLLEQERKVIQPYEEAI